MLLLSLLVGLVLQTGAFPWLQGPHACRVCMCVCIHTCRGHAHIPTLASMCACVYMFIQTCKVHVCVCMHVHPCREGVGVCWHMLVGEGLCVCVGGERGVLNAHVSLPSLASQGCAQLTP